MSAQQNTAPPVIFPGGIMQRRLLDALENNESYYELAIELVELGIRLQNDPDLARQGVNMATTAHSLRRQQQCNWELIVLLLSMERSAVRAVILGTVAHDAACGMLKAYTKPHNESYSQGIYVIGLKKAGTAGLFLNQHELRRLIKGVEDYILGAQIFAAKALTQCTSGERALVRWIKSVDGNMPINYRAAPAGRPERAKFIQSQKEVETARLLVESLNRRLLASASVASPATASGAAPRQVQSPLYVGCSANLEQRLGNYAPTQRMTKINKPLALTVCILQAQKVDIQLDAHVVLQTWKPEQLALAEQLVISLAGSLIHQTGFNLIPGGTNSGSAAGIGRAEEKILSGRPGYLQANLDASLQDRRQRRDFEYRLQQIDAEIDACFEEAKRGYPQDHTQIVAFTSRPAAATIETARLDLERLNQQLREAEIANQRAKSMWSVMKAGWPDLCTRAEDEYDRAMGEVADQAMGDVDDE
ncbi:uncharacterized protein UV8b_05738 [Ustilaginoidea virens]|uniref:Uncharacterized protein n=1 Tax=Ustilaginoidea virens TaxID=1159556 RepID=A0A8E5HU79_USTVR|nr:uncharacterized protein UV8b_05738 [Ustilaginoidea virens]QUC21495.1 hypothetical protein UV8b_05738 [Ustilaginoidea virens]